MTGSRAKRRTEAASPREQRRISQLDLGRNQLLDAAEIVFGRRGFHEASIKEIAELAEFSVGSVYSFFENKDDLFRQLFARRGDEFMPLMRHLLSDEPPATSSRDRLHRLVDLQIDYFRRHPRFGRLYLRFSGPALQIGDRLADDAVIANFHEAMELQTELFVAGQRSGEFHTGDPNALARLFSGIVGAFQAVDPSVISDEPNAPESMTLAELHAIVDRAFCLPVP